MKISTLKLILLAVCACASSALHAQSIPAEPLRLGMQTYSYRGLSLEQALDETRKIGIDTVQVYPGQQLGSSFADGEKLHHSMSAASRDKLLKLAKDKGVRIASYGVLNVKDAAEWEQVFQFAKAMAMDFVAVRPHTDTWGTVLPQLERLSKQSGIAVGVYNHAENVLPAATLQQVTALAPSLYLFPNTGHWVRDGIDPIAALKAYEGRLVGAQMADVDEINPEAINTIWGEGIGYIPGQLAELRRQKFKGVVYIEFSNQKMTPEVQQLVIREAAASAEYFARTQKATDAQLVSSEVLQPNFLREKDILTIKPKSVAGLWPEPGALFDANLSNAIIAKGASWKWNGDILSGTGDILTRQAYLHYTVAFEFRCEKGAEGGVYLNVPNAGTEQAVKVVINQNDTPDDTQLTGAISHLTGASYPVKIEPGKWYSMVVTVFRGSVDVSIDGESMVSMRIANWTTPGQNPNKTPNPYKKAVKDMFAKGRIGLADSKGGIQFRNLTLESL